MTSEQALDKIAKELSMIRMIMALDLAYRGPADHYTSKLAKLSIQATEYAYKEMTEKP